jgi:hypothetical protein
MGFIFEPSNVIHKRKEGYGDFCCFSFSRRHMSLFSALTLSNLGSLWLSSYLSYVGYLRAINMLYILVVKKGLFLMIKHNN